MTTPNWQAIAEQWLPGVIAQYPEVTSGDLAYAWMRDNELYVPRRYVRDAWRELVIKTGYVPLINRLDDDALVPRRWVTETAQQFARLYAYRVHVRGRIIETQEVIDETYTLTSDRRLSVGEIRDWGVERIYEYGYEVDVEFPDYDIVGVLHVTGQPY